MVTPSLTDHGNERQRCVNDIRSCESDNHKEDMVAVTHSRNIGHLEGKQCQHRHRYYLFKMSVNELPTIFVLASWLSKQLCDDI